MYSVSNDYMNVISSFGGRQFDMRIDFNGSYTITSAEIKSLKHNEVINTGDTLTMGCTCMSKITLDMFKPAGLIGLDKAYIKPESGLMVSGEYEWVPLGTYYVADVSTKDNYRTVQITAYDGMSRLEQEFDASALNWPASIESITRTIASQCGVEIAETVEFPVHDIEWGSYEERFTCRQMVGYIAGIMGTNARFNRNGLLDFVWYGEPVNIIDNDHQFRGGFARLTEDDFVINSIVSGTNENSITAGNGTGISFTNPFMTQEVLDEIYERVNGLTYTPGTVKWRGNPAIEAGDTIIVTDQNQDEHTLLITEQTTSYTGGVFGEIKSAGKSEQSIVLSRSPTETKIELAYRSMEEALRRATEKITGENGGYFVLNHNEEGLPSGFSIMDTPTKTAYTRMWTWSFGGLAFSNNGGATYSEVAITNDGAISANAITTGQMSADRIIVGDEALSSFIRFEDGKIILGEAGNELILNIKNDRISFESGGQEIAYFSNNSFELESIDRIRFGNFAFYPRQNGNLTFTKVV